MYYKHQTKGIVLGSKAEGDHSRRVSLFTLDFGLITARVQGARETRSKLRSGSQDFCLGDFSLVHGKAGWKVVSANASINLFETFRSTPQKLKVITNILNLVKKLVDEDDGKDIFDIINNFVNFLISAKESDIAVAECLVLLRILHALGYMRHDPEFGLPINTLEVNVANLEMVAPKRLKMIALINESLKATNLT